VLCQFRCKCVYRLLLRLYHLFVSTLGQVAQEGDWKDDHQGDPVPTEHVVEPVADRIAPVGKGANQSAVAFLHHRSGLG